MNNRQHVSHFRFHVSRFTFYALSLILILFVSACTLSATADQPPEIRYGYDVCDQCGMIISEPRFAAAYVTQQGETRRFDDIGDMVIYYTERGEAVKAFWVNDYHTETWTRAESATFVHVPGLSTPMGHGVAALAQARQARELAAELGGETMTFEDLLARHETFAKMPGHMHDHHNGHNHMHGNQP